MEPRIVNRDEFKVIGTEYIGKNENGEIPKMWQEQFLPRMNDIPSVTGCCTTYGVCYVPEGAGPGEFGYMACREVSSIDSVPQGMVGRLVPGNTYAVFTHKGSLETLKDTWNYIYSTWLPNSEYEAGDGCDFELYDERFMAAGKESELDIYIPVKPKQV